MSRSQGDLFQPSDGAAGADGLGELHARIDGCRQCPALVESRTRPVPGVGPSDARVLIVGEAPGRHEDERGEPFVGAAGAYLMELLGRVGLDRSDVFITNVVKCRPPGNRNPRASEVSSCADYLDRQLELVKPDLVLLLGRCALERFFPGEKITRAAGVPRRGRIGDRDVTFLPLLHPAFGIRRRDLKPEIERSYSKIRGILEESRRTSGDGRGAR